MKDLSCFFYRTSPGWREPHGRVITEAMAMGVPVVVGSGGGYTEFIENGFDGFIIDSNEEAFFIINKLKNDAKLWSFISKNASNKMQKVMQDCSSKSNEFIFSKSKIYNVREIIKKRIKITNNST